MHCLLGLVEGRFPNEDIFDPVAQHCFPESERLHAGSDVIMHNLTQVTSPKRTSSDHQHYKEAKAGENQGEEYMVEQHIASMSQIALDYFLLAKVISEGSAKHGKRILEKIEKWETDNKASLRAQIGR